MRKKYYVRLIDEERQYAREVMEAPDTTPLYQKRTNILLMTDESVGKTLTHEAIAAPRGDSFVTVWHTVRDYCE